MWLFLCCQLTSAWGFVEVPKLSSRVTDLTGTLNPSQVQALDSKLAAFEAKKGTQIAVLIVPTTEPEDIAEFGIKVADLWRIGRKGVDDGLILIIAKNDRKLRIEVGYGLEGVVPDAVAKRITSEIIKPYLKSGDFAGGIDAGVNQIIGLIDGEQLPPPTPQQNGGVQLNEGNFIFVLFAGLFAGSVLSSMFGRVTGGLIAGLGSAGIASLMMGFGLGAIFIGIIVFFLISARGGGGGWSNGGGGYFPGGGGYYRGGGGGGG
ncbi:MAG: YgcG family protein, partial [Methyloglobulus sp.]|nr:YgcG family protein [Methyloglobulus sp.]